MSTLRGLLGRLRTSTAVVPALLGVAAAVGGTFAAGPVVGLTAGLVVAASAPFAMRFAPRAGWQFLLGGTRIDYAGLVQDPTKNSIVISVVGCVAGTLLTKAEDEEVLKNFYKTVNPWGWWGPVRARVMQEDPAFVPNRSAGHDLTNVAVGIVWQLCLVTLPIYIVLQQWPVAGGILGLLAITSIYMKFNWYDRLEKAPG